MKQLVFIVLVGCPAQAPIAPAVCFVPVACTVDDAGRGHEVAPPPTWTSVTGSKLPIRDGGVE